MLFGRKKQENYSCPECECVVSGNDLRCPRCGADLTFYAEAVRTWANSNDVTKLADLSTLYLSGTYVPQSYEKALKFLTKAAEGGVASAQYNLGLVYEQGEGVSQDYYKAFYWYRKAAENGHPMAQGNLGVFYLDGKGTAENRVRGLYWLNKGRKNGDQSSRDILFQMGIGEMVFLDEDSLISAQRMR